MEPQSGSYAPNVFHNHIVICFKLRKVSRMICTGPFCSGSSQTSCLDSASIGSRNSTLVGPGLSQSLVLCPRCFQYYRDILQNFTGMITESVDRDRVIVQCFMNLVLISQTQLNQLLTPSSLRQSSESYSSSS